MQFQRTFLICALFVVGLLLVNEWQTEQLHHKAQQAATVANAKAQSGSTANSSQSVPSLTAAKKQQAIKSSNTVAAAASSEQAIPASRLISIKTDVLNVLIDKKGGNVVKVSLPKYPAKVNEPKTPFQLLYPKGDDFYIARSGLVSSNGPDTVKTGQGLYQATQSSYQLSQDARDLKVILTWRGHDGVVVNKIFTFKRNSYVVGVNYQINNAGSNTWSGHTYQELVRKDAKKHGSILGYHTFTGAAYSSPSEPYEKLSFKKMGEDSLSQNIKGGWAAMIQHYFLSAWVPNNKLEMHYYTRKLNNDKYAIGMVGPEVKVAPGAKLETNARLYVGPIVTKRLAAVAPHLELTVDYGFLWWLSVPILKVMQFIHHFIGNWGVAIILVTLFIKLLFYKLSASSYRSMARMRAMQPKMKAIKERYGDDKQKVTQATMELYKKEKINPLGGCLPVIIQIPVFLALYWVLLDSVEFRQAPFIFWITDLSVKDPFYILPVLMGLSMFAQQKISPAPPDPTQAKVMMLMPVVFTFFFLGFPSGLVLYWLVNNILSVTQQWWIMRVTEKEDAANKRSKKRKK